MNENGRGFEIPKEMRSMAEASFEQARGALSILTKRETYLKSGEEFDPQAMIDFLRQAEVQAIADGFSGLRVLGEMMWALGPKVTGHRLIEYEALLNKSLENSRSLVLCQYNRQRFDPAVIHDILRTHPATILGIRGGTATSGRWPSSPGW